MARIKFSDHLSRWREQGWCIERTNGGHLRCSHPNATNVVFVSSNPKEWRSLENTEALLRKALRGAAGTAKQPSAVTAAPLPPVPKTAPPPRTPTQAPAIATAPAPKPSTPSRPHLAPEIIGAVQFLIMRTRCEGGSWKAVRIYIRRFRNDPQFRDGCIKAYRYEPAHQLRILRGRLRAGEGIARETGQPIPPPKLGKLTLGKPLARPLTPVIPGLRTVEVNRLPSRHSAHANHAPQQEVRPPRPQRETTMGLALTAALGQRVSAPPEPPKVPVSPPAVQAPKPTILQPPPLPALPVAEPVVAKAPEAVAMPVAKAPEPVPSPKPAKAVRKPTTPLSLDAMRAAKGLMESALAVAPPKKRRSLPRPVVVEHVKPKSRNTDRDADIMDRFANKKLSAMQIAEHHGVSVATVTKVIKNAHRSDAAPKPSNVVGLRVPDTTHGMGGSGRMIATGGGKK